METLKSLRHVSRRAGGPAGSAIGESATIGARGQAMRGILVPVLALLSFGGTAIASSGHISGHVLPSAHQSANRSALRTRADTVRPCKTRRPWMYKATGSRPRSDGVRPKRPWMYGIPGSTGAAATPKRPWMYGTPTSSGGWVACLASHHPS